MKDIATKSGFSVSTPSSDDHGDRACGEFGIYPAPKVVPSGNLVVTMMGTISTPSVEFT